MYFISSITNKISYTVYKTKKGDFTILLVHLDLCEYQLHVKLVTLNVINILYIITMLYGSLTINSYCSLIEVQTKYHYKICKVYLYNTSTLSLIKDIRCITNTLALMVTVIIIKWHYMLRVSIIEYREGPLSYNCYLAYSKI